MRHGDVRGIKDLLSIYKDRLRPPQESVVQEFLRVLKEHHNIEIPRTAVQYKPASRTLVLSIAGPQKTEILLRRAELLKLCAASLGPKGAPHHII